MARAVQGEPEEQAAAARVREHGRSKRHIGAGRGLASDGPRRHGGVGPERQLAGEQRLHALLILEYEDDVGGLDAELPAEAAAV